MLKQNLLLIKHAYLKIEDEYSWNTLMSHSRLDP